MMNPFWYTKNESNLIVVFEKIYAVSHCLGDLYFLWPPPFTVKILLCPMFWSSPHISCFRYIILVRLITLRLSSGNPLLPVSVSAKRSVFFSL